jgi:hypothetical protein
MIHFYDGQIRRYLSQMIRLLSDFKIKSLDGTERVVPVVYGDLSKQVASIIKDNSENKLPSSPRIAVYMTNLELDKSRLSDATYTHKINIRERNINNQGKYDTTQGTNYSVERIMPTPYTLTVKADIWTTTTDMKLQILEQILVLFNPSLEIQTTDNYIDWTSLTVVELSGVTLSGRSVPAGVDTEIEISTLEFEMPIYISAPTMVTRLGVIHNIITRIFNEETGTLDPDFIYGQPASVQYTTPGNYGILVINNEVRLLDKNENVSDDEIPQKYGNSINWYKLLDQYGRFRAGSSRIFLKKDDGTEVVGTISVHPSDEAVILANWDSDTYPSNTIILGRGTIDAIIDPLTYNPPDNIAAGIRYLLLNRIGDPNNDGSTGSGPRAWKNDNDSDFIANENDIIEWNGNSWSVVFDSVNTIDTTYVTNLRTGVQFKWDGEVWTKSFEGEYPAGLWRLVI